MKIQTCKFHDIDNHRLNIKKEELVRFVLLLRKSTTSIETTEILPAETLYRAAIYFKRYFYIKGKLKKR
jgi:hypothetical protein